MRVLDFRAMGSQIRAIVDSDSTAAARALSRVPLWFAGWERQLSRFRAESELSRLNRAAGRRTRVGAELLSALQAALDGARLSDGLVTPTVLPALVAAGYDRDFARLRAGGQAPERAAPPGRSLVGDWRAVAVDPAERSVSLPPGVRLDLGGTAKGWAAERAAGRLAELAPALVDAGGDVAVSGMRADGQPWPIGVADPRDPDRQLDLLALDRGGVATSGRDFRRWEQHGEARHHIIDTRTGRPAETDVLCATVVGPSLVEAEVAAKVALILGGEAGARWIEARPHLAGLLVLESGQVIRSRRLDDYLWR